MKEDITIYLEEGLGFSRSSHLGHKTEFEIKDRAGSLRLNFDTKEVLDDFYDSFLEFYQEAKDFYKRQGKKD